MAVMSHAGSMSSENLKSSRTNQFNPFSEPAPKKANCYTSSYVGIVINIINKMGLSPIEQTMTDESSLMDVTDKIQKCLQDVQSFYQKIESESESSGAWIQYHYHSSDYIGPNAYDGLKSDYYKQTVQHNTAPSGNWNGINGNWYGSEQVSSQFQKDMSGYINSIKELFQCGTITGKDAVPASSLGKFSVQRFDKNGNYATITVDMTSTYQKLNSGPFADFIKMGVHSFIDPASAGNTSASLIMQYVYDKAKVATDTLGVQSLFNIAQQDPQDPTKWLISDASQIIDFDPQNGGDGVLRMQYNLLNDLNTQITVSRSIYHFSSYNNKTSANLLQMIFDTGGPDLNQGSWDTKHSSGSVGIHYNQSNGRYNPGLANQHMGLYGTFSYLAFNYFWSKNPTSSISDPTGDKEMPDQNPNDYGPGPWSPYGTRIYGTFGHVPQWNTCSESGDKDDYGDLFGKPESNQLGTLANDTQSSVSLISSSNNETSTSMQEMTSEHATFVNIAQNTIKGNSQNLKVAVNNNNA